MVDISQNVHTEHIWKMVCLEFIIEMYLQFELCNSSILQLRAIREQHCVLIIIQKSKPKISKIVHLEC